MDKIKFGKRLRKLREKAGLTAPDLANRVGYADKSGIYKLEQGKAVPGPKIKLLADCLGVTVDELLEVGKALNSDNLKLPTPLLTATMGEDPAANALFIKTLLEINLRLGVIERRVDDLALAVRTHQHPIPHAPHKKMA